MLEKPGPVRVALRMVKWPRAIAGTSTLSLSILQSILRSDDEYINEQSAPQRTRADVRRMPRKWRYGGTGCEVLCNSCERTPVTAGGNASLAWTGTDIERLSSRIVCFPFVLLMKS